MLFILPEGFDSYRILPFLGTYEIRPCDVVEMALWMSSFKLPKTYSLQVAFKFLAIVKINVTSKLLKSTYVKTIVEVVVSKKG